MAADDRPDDLISLFLIDDHPVVGLGLSLALQGHNRFRLAGSATNRWTGLRTIETLRPDAVVVDLVFDGEAETGFVRECRALLPDAMIVVFSSLPRRAYEREAIDLGADAYVAKSSDIVALVDTIARIAGRQAPSAAHAVPPAPPVPVDGTGTIIDGVYLTQREAEVAQRLGEGISIARIASDLRISPNTAGVHRDNIRKKLKCRDMTELVALLARNKVRMHGSV